jgi:hypothetical protein
VVQRCKPVYWEAALGPPQYANTFCPFCRTIFRVPCFESRCVPGNRQWGLRFEQSRKNSRACLRKRLSLPERVGIALIRVRLDGVLLCVDDALVVSWARTLDRGDA